MGAIDAELDVFDMEGGVNCVCASLTVFTWTQ